MKVKIFLTIFLLLFILITPGIFAQDIESSQIQMDQPEQIDEPQNKLLFVFYEGATASWLTRIIKQNDRNNFVFKDFLPGLYFKTELHNIKYVTPMARIAAYYPLFSYFNEFPQTSRTPLHFAVDMALGVRFNIFDFSFLRINAAPALHMFFLNADRWNYFNLGAAGFLEFQLPLTERWTLLVNGIASIDNGNFGGNSLMEPFDIVWQYQVDIGVRYSKKLTNGTFIIKRKGEADASLRVNR